MPGSRGTGAAAWKPFDPMPPPRGGRPDDLGRMPVEFDSSAQQSTYEMVATWMGELYGDEVQLLDTPPGFVVHVGSAVVKVTVTPWGEEDALIETGAMVVRDTAMTEGLMRYLLLENHSRLFGAFSIDQENRIFFQHNLVGSSCQKNELESSVVSVAQTADYYDDLIVEQFGGLRAVDELIVAEFSRRQTFGDE